jgi:hypothetical protein
MKPCVSRSLRALAERLRVMSTLVLLTLAFTFPARAQSADALVGVWAADEGFQIVEHLFRSDGRYQLDTRSTDPFTDYSFSERGFYSVANGTLEITPYDYLGEPEPKRYSIELSGGALSLTRVEFPSTRTYQYKPGSREEVLSKQAAPRVLIGAWTRDIAFWGRTEYTFRPGGYYALKDMPEGFAPDYIRGRYAFEGDQVVIHPYSGTEAVYEADFFGDTLTLIKREDFFAESRTYQRVPGSEAAVRAKAAEAEAFRARENWHVGVWEIRTDFRTLDLTIRPDGHYMSRNQTEFLSGIVRGRYTLEPTRIHFDPFVGQGIYSPDNGEFGKVPRTREIDYYDGELQLIDLNAISQSVTILKKRPGSEELILEKTAASKAVRETEGWQLGIWEVNDPAGWMEFTFRPDNRYIIQAGNSPGAPSRVERGRYGIAPDKITLAPYTGLGAARGFEWDYYDGDLFLIGDLARMVVARKVPNSESEVREKTENPIARQGERGPLLGLWTANRPGEYVELVFRPDGEFRLSRCAFDVISHDYGIFSADVAADSLVWDSRFHTVQSRGLDYYGDTLTIHGGEVPPSTYTVNLGMADQAIAASYAADEAESQIDQQWIARTPIAPRNPNAVQVPTGTIPADPNPGRIFESPTVFSEYRLYRRLIPGLVYFNEMGAIRSVNVVNTREWHFFPTGRVLVRFTHHRAGVVYPTTFVETSDSWAAYHIGPRSGERDILHRYSDNVVFLDTDLGEQIEMTLEDGRRNLFWGKDYQLLSEWAAEQQNIPCELPANAEGRLLNTGVDLTTTIAPDALGEVRPVLTGITGPVSGYFILSGTAEGAGHVIVERSTSLGPPMNWTPVQTNSVAEGPFTVSIAPGPEAAAYFRLRGM